MHLNDYHDLAQRTAKQFPTRNENLNHAALGMATELIESLSSKTSEHAAEELGDLCWYLPVTCQALGVKLGDMVSVGLRRPVEQVTTEYFDALSAEDDSEGWVQAGLTSTGNLITMVKRLVIYDKELTVEMRAEAHADLYMTLRYVALASRLQASTTLTAVLQANIDKLKKRFPDAYSNEAAEGRADKAGADARVS